MVHGALTATPIARSAPIDLALSGGGVRAMAFHAGVLRFLAERDAFSRVEQLSTVSGGSLLVGLIVHLSGMSWPSSRQFAEEVAPAVRRMLTSQSLQMRAFRRLLRPWNWRYFFSRGNVVAAEIAHTWGVRARLSELPASPRWSINGTTAETGRRFRFKAGRCGDYQLGYAEAGQFALSEALAMSAAFPGGIGPLTLRTDRYVWRKRDRWGDPLDASREVQLPYRRLHIYDGGLYDNLGLEPLFDAGTQHAKTPGHMLVASDAGAPLAVGFHSGNLSPGRVKRWLDVCMEQQRALRVRGFVTALRRGMPGAYLQIGSRAAAQLRERGQPEADDHQWLSDLDVARAAASPTSLHRLSEEQFDLLCRHGYETALWNDVAHPYLRTHEARVK